MVGLKKAAAENKLTREGIIDALESLQDVDLGVGQKISFSKENHQAFDKVWPVIFKAGKYVPLDWAEIKSKLNP